MPDLLVEVRCEELPHEMVSPARDALADGLVALLSGIEHGAVRTWSTPRRLAVGIEDVATGRPVEDKLVTGPPVAAAKRDGEWTRAALGFARGRGVDVDDLVIVEGPKGPVVGATIRVGGERTLDLVAAGLEKLIVGLPFKKSMRWGDGPTRWGRPLHQVVAVFDGNRVPATVAGIATSDVVVGHRRCTLSPGPVRDLASYPESLEARWVIADRGRRTELIRELLLAAAAEHQVEVPIDEVLLEEVTDLVEWPVVVVGSFDAELLDLPGRLLVESMKVHQRTFPTMKDGRLHNLVLCVSNNPTGDAKLIAHGNAKVLRARFYDAKFFFAEDKKRGLSELGQGLSKMRWVRGLGTMLDKQARLRHFAGELAPRLGANPAQAQRAAHLAKNDLVSQMVAEFPKLQGHMGRLYAQHESEDDVVALAIEEHYLPRFAGDVLPSTAEGAVVALADRLDTLAGCFSIGLLPKSSADPQGLRRAANGVLAILLDRGLRVELGDLLEPFCVQYPELDAAKLVQFVRGRLRAQLVADHATDLVDAVLEAGGEDVVQVEARVQALTALSASGQFGSLMTAFKRVLNISKDHTDSSYHRGAFIQPAEHALADAFEAAAEGIPAQLDSLDIEGAIDAMIAMKPAIDGYFDNVLVMAEDHELRTARLGLLRAISGLFRSVADFRLIHTE